MIIIEKQSNLRQVVLYSEVPIRLYYVRDSELVKFSIKFWNIGLHANKLSTCFSTFGKFDWIILNHHRSFSNVCIFTHNWFQSKNIPLSIRSCYCYTLLQVCLINLIILYISLKLHLFRLLDFIERNIN